MTLRRTRIKRRAPLRRGAPPPRRGKSERCRLDDQAQAVWKQIIRLRDADCRIQMSEHCSRRNEVAHHMVRRQHRGCLHLSANGLGICKACHAWIHHDHCDDEPALYRSVGVDWDALILRKHTGGKGLDLKLVILGLRADLARMGGKAGGGADALREHMARRHACREDCHGVPA